MTDFSYQLYSSRNFPPARRHPQDAEAARLHLRRGLRRPLRRRGQGRRAEASTSPPAASPCRPATSASTWSRTTPPASSTSPRPSTSRRSTCPYLTARAAPDHRRRLRRLRQAPAGGGKPYRDAGLGFGWHNHAFEFEKLADGAIPQVAIFEGGPDLEWEADLAWVIKGGADPLEWIKTFGKRLTAVHLKDIAPAGENADEDGWADLGHGTVDWKGADGGAARTPASSTSSWSTTTRRTPRASPSARSPPRSSSEDPTMADTARHRHHRLRQHLRPPTSASRRCSAASRSAPAPTSSSPPPRRAPRSSASRPRPSTPSSPTTPSTSSST